MVFSSALIYLLLLRPCSTAQRVGLKFFKASQPPNPANPTAPTPPAQTPQASTSFCHFSRLSASEYPTSGLKVTISYKLVQPLTRLVGNGLVSESARDAVFDLGRMVDKNESR